MNIEDNVNHPQHYIAPNGIECIQAIEAALGNKGTIAYCKGNALKYIFRSDKKGKEKEDIQKAMWYLQYVLNLIGDNNG